MNKGLMHLYCGDGKGKTTAAAGLALRALGSGRSVVFVQFLKSGDSAELKPLENSGAVILSGDPGGRPAKFSRNMNESERAEAAAVHNAYLRRAGELSPDLLVLDEACAALNAGLVDESLLREIVLKRPGTQEIVLTGRKPAPWMEAAADYITEMVCRRHPYERGVAAREGIEF